MHHYQGKNISSKQLVSMEFRVEKEGHFAVLTFSGEEKKKRTKSFQKLDELQTYIGSLDYSKLTEMPEEK